ncbi:MAG: GNAT family N-acetyltransferase [Ignavibacteria bacterium]|nr:GNAT family N-acetyltransferase [Ignavibacteria bacterium]
MISYRVMEAGDHEKCIELWKVTEGMGFIESDTSDSLRFYLERNPGMSFVSYNEDNLIGTILGGHDGRRGYIYHLAVKKEYRGNLIGKTLVELSLDKIKSAGIQRCIIMLKSDNEANANFWLKNGFDRREDLNMFSIDL